MSSYYCQIAGLPEVAFDGSKLQFSVQQFKDEIYPSLSPADARCIDLFFLARDNANILELLRNGENARIMQCGCYTVEELQEMISSAKEGDKPLEGVPQYLHRFLVGYFEKEGQSRILWDDVLSAGYYEYASRCSNAFIAGWFAFNRNVNNILVAMAARKYKMSVADAVIGDDEIAEALRTSAARDFGLSDSVEYLEELQRINDSSKLLERERQLDDMRWKWLEENSVFNYFTIERLFVFVQKISIVERWAALDAETGMQRYTSMVNELKGSAQISKSEKK